MVRLSSSFGTETSTQDTTDAQTVLRQKWNTNQHLDLEQSQGQDGAEVEELCKN